MAEFNLNTFLQDNSIQLEDTESVAPSLSTGFDLNTFLENNSITTIGQEADEYTESEAYAHAAWLGLSDTGRGVLQFMGIAEEGMQEDKEILKALEKKYGAGITATYIGGMIADPVGWVVPVAKARTVGKLAWEGAKWGGLAGGLGYVDEEEGQTRPGNLVMGAMAGTIAAPVFGKAIQGAGKIKDLVMRKNADEIFDNPVAALEEIGEAPSSMAQNIKSAYIKPFQKGDSSDKDRTNWAHRVVFSNPGVFLGGATGGALGGTQEYDSPAANIFGWTVAGAAMGATGFRAIGAINLPGIGKEYPLPFVSRMVKGEGNVADFMANAFIENNGLKAKYADVIKMKEDNFADANNIGYQFLDIAEQMSKLKPEESKLLYQFLDGRLGKTDLTPDLLTMGEDARKAIVDAGQRLVDVGALNKDVWLKNIDSYIHRSYIKHLPKGQRESAWRRIWSNDNVRLMADELRMRGKVQEFVRPKEGVDDWREAKVAEGWEFLPNAAKEKRKDAFRYNYTLEQRAEMGEIEDASYAMLETGKLYTNDIAALGLYNDVFKAHARLDAKKLKSLNTKADKMLAQGRFNDEDLITGKEEAAKAARDLWVRERTPSQGLEISGEAEAKALGLKQVPETNIKGTKIKLFGNLSGSYIPEEIYSDLISFKGIMKYVEDHENSLIKASRKMFQSYRLGNQMWKRSKTSWNPTVHTNNIMSNFMLMDLLKVPYKYLNVGRHIFTEKGRKLLDSKYDNLYTDLSRAGVLDAGLAKQELGFASNKWADAYKIQDDVLKKMKSPEGAVESAASIANKVYKQVKNPLNPVLKFGKLLDQKATSIYSKEDQMFRIALYKHRLDEGMKKITSVKGTPEFDREIELLKRSAAKQAKRGFIDYDVQAPGIKILRETSSPFISYTYRVIPLLAETATLRPMKFAKWAAIGYGLNFVGRELSEGNEEAERGMMSSQALQHMFGVPFMPYTTIKLPDRVGKLFTMGFDEDPVTGKEFPNRSMYLNTSRWIPGGDVLGLTGQAGAEGMSIPGLPAPLQPSFGLMGDVFFSLVMGEDAFTGKKINSAQEGFYYEQLARGQHLLRKLLPNNPLVGDFGLFPDEEAFRSYSQRKIIRALSAGEATGRLPGRYDLPVLQAVAQTMGIKLHPFEPHVENQLRTFEYKKKVSQFKSEVRRIGRQVRSGVMSRDEGAEIIEELRQDLEEVVLRYRKKRKSSSKAKGYKEGGVIDLDIPEEQGFNPNINYKKLFTEASERAEREEIEARPRRSAAEELSQLEKAVEVGEGGLPKAYTYMTSYDTRRKPTFKYGGAFGAFDPRTKEVWARSYRKGRKGTPTTYTSKQSLINTEQHESTHAFIDFLKEASVNKEILKTLSDEARKNLLQFVTFHQKVTKDPSGRIFNTGIEHDTMNLPDLRNPPVVKEVHEPYSIRGDEKYSIYEEAPYPLTPDDIEGVGRTATIERLADHFLKASAKNPKVHKKFMKKWVKGGDKSKAFLKADFSELKKLVGKEEKGFVTPPQEEEFPSEEQGRASGGTISSPERGITAQMEELGIPLEGRDVATQMTELEGEYGPHQWGGWRGGSTEEEEEGISLEDRDLATQMAELEGEMSGITHGASRLTGATEGERTIGEAIPGISEGIDIADLAKAVREDDPWGMGISAASLAIGSIPFAGDVLRQSFRTFVKPVAKQLEDADRLINSDQLEAIQTAKRGEVSEIKAEKARELNEINDSKLGDINYIDPEKFGGKGYRKYPEDVSDLKKILSTEGITDAERLDAIQKTKAITFGEGYKTFGPIKWGIPPRIFNADEIDNIVPTFEDMVIALGPKRIKKQGLLGFNKKKPEGYTHEGLILKNGILSLKDNVFVKARLDITAYQEYNTWIASVKLAEGKGSASMFSKVAVLQRREGKPMFELIESAEEKAMNIGAGTGKGPFATIQGNWQDVTPEAAINRAKEAINSKEYIQVGYDPDRASYFFDKVTGEPVLDAEEIIQIGPLVLAKFRKPDETQLKTIEKLMTQKYSSGGFINRERIN